MIPVMVINNESLSKGLLELDFVRTYQHRKNGVVASQVLKDWKQYDYIAHDNLGLFSWNYFDELFDYSKFFYMISYPCEFYSTSIGPAAICSKVVDGVYVTESPVISREGLLYLASKRIQVLKQNLNVKLSFENTAFRKGNGAYKHITDADFISQLVRDNDVGFTLDLAHAEVTARAKRISIYAYLDSLPLERCCEIHLSTPRGLVDSHELPNRITMNLFEYVKSKVKQEAYVVVEYYRNMNSLRYFYETVLKRYVSE